MSKIEWTAEGLNWFAKRHAEFVAKLGTKGYDYGLPTQDQVDEQRKQAFERLTAPPAGPSWPEADRGRVLEGTKRYMDALDANREGGRWLGSIVESLPREPFDEITNNTVGRDGSATIFWRDRRPYAAWFVVRDEMNFSILIRWQARDPVQPDRPTDRLVEALQYYDSLTDRPAEEGEADGAGLGRDEPESAFINRVRAHWGRHQAITDESDYARLVVLASRHENLVSARRASDEARQVAERERDALLAHAAANGNEPDLLIDRWREAEAERGAMERKVGVLRNLAARNCEHASIFADRAETAEARVEELTAALRFYRDAWETVMDGDVGGDNPILIRSSPIPNDDLYCDGGQRAARALSSGQVRP